MGLHCPFLQKVEELSCRNYMVGTVKLPDKISEWSINRLVVRHRKQELA